MSTSHSSPPPPPKQPLPPKKEVALALLERSSVHVHLDPRAAGVAVPAWFRKQAQLVLQVGLNMPVPIPDLRLDDEGMKCTLSFSRSPFYCVVPWQSVFAMVDDDGRGMVWPEDVPPELATQARSAEAARTQLRAAPALAPEASPEGDAAPRASAPREPATASEKPRTRKPRAKKARAVGSVSGVTPGEPELRPTLVAVPAPEARARAESSDKSERSEKAEREKRPVPRAEPVVESPRPEAARKAPPLRPLPAGPPKPKRELPPYLRVVK